MCEIPRTEIDKLVNMTIETAWVEAHFSGEKKSFLERLMREYFSKEVERPVEEGDLKDI